MTVRLDARAPRGEVRLPPGRDDTDAFLLDAAYFPGGHAPRVYEPRTEGEVAAVLREHDRVLAIGAQSSLTGGATPRGDVLLSTAKLNDMELDPAARTVRCGAGVACVTVQDAASPHGLFVAPAPTYDGAFVGGMVSTNAAGAATFKYGTMRDAVRSLTVVLADGSVLDLRRGDHAVPRGESFELELIDGRVVQVPTPDYLEPEVPKCSAGYHAADPLDLVDLFIGAEGTLGVVTEVTLELTPRPESSLTCWLPVADEVRGLKIVAALRDAARQTWETGDVDGLDVRSIEHMDGRAIELLLEDGAHREHGVPLAAGDAMVLLFTLDFATELTEDDVFEAIDDPDGPDQPVRRLLAVLGDEADRLEVAFPGDTDRVRRFAAMREAVPMAVNHRIRDRRLVDPRVTKVAADYVVPFERFAEALGRYRDAFEVADLDLVVWGHVSDGNVHPNALCRDGDEVERAEHVLLELADWVVSVGGSPLAEHGCGRNPVKQEMLRRLRGDSGVACMRRVKAALDPRAKLARGVLFPHA